MRAIRIYRNPDCAKCARYARMHERLDWLGRVKVSTGLPPGYRPLLPGEVVVQRLVDGELLHGAAAFAEICRQIPAYALLRPLLLIPALRRAVDREMAGCDGAACVLPTRR